MQTLSLAALSLLAQAPPAPDLKAMALELARRLAPDWPLLALYFVLTQVLAVVSYWMAAKPLTEQEDDRFVNAIKVWGLYFAFGLAAGVVSAILVPKTFLVLLQTGGKVQSMSSLPLAAGLIALMGLVMLVALFVVPMKVYNFRFSSAAIFVVMMLVLQAVGGFALNLAFMVPFGRVAARVQEWQRQTAPGTAQPSWPVAPSDQTFRTLEKRASDKTKSPQERQQALKELYTQLEQLRATLRFDTPAGVADYERRKARYELILADLKAEVAAQRPAR